MSIYAAISDQTLSTQAALDFVGADENGAVLLFVGAVRNHNLNRTVRGVTYDCFDALATKTLSDIAHEAVAMTDPHLRAFAVHFRGFLPIGGPSVVIATASPHRDSAYVANRYIIEQIKQRLPVWKQEHYADGHEEWLGGHAVTPSQ